MNNTDEADLPHNDGDWVALTRAYESAFIVPVPVGKTSVVPFGAVGKILLRTEDGLYNIAFHAGWVALDVPHKILRPARMLEQLALCADGC